MKTLKGTSINCLCPLRDLKRVATRREPQQNGHSILKAYNVVDACFRSRPTGLYGQPRLCVALSRQAISMALKARLDSELAVKPEAQAINRGALNHIDPLTRYSKRLCDLLFASTGLLITLPLLPLIALAIRLNSPGPVFFKQMRIGKATPDHVALFEMIKFRTMVNDAERQSGATWAKKQDPRITAVGLFLRRTRLDELPQFINVLKGEMSVIGPRPERPGFYQKLENDIPFFVERTYGVAPGITGLAQVNQGYDTCIDDVRAKVGFDHSYGLALGGFSTWLKMDLSISLKTFAVMIMGRGQ